MKMISPSNREVDVGKTLSETEYIGMCRWVLVAVCTTIQPAGQPANQRASEDDAPIPVSARLPAPFLFDNRPLFQYEPLPVTPSNNTPHHRREVMDDFLRKRAEKNGASVINGLMMRMEQPGAAAAAAAPTLYVLLCVVVCI
jgi:hypothetical protein